MKITDLLELEYIGKDILITGTFDKPFTIRNIQNITKTYSFDVPDDQMIYDVYGGLWHDPEVNGYTTITEIYLSDDIEII